MYLRIVPICLLVAIFIFGGMIKEVDSLELGSTIKLVPPYRKGNVSVEEAISKRRSIRDFSNTPLKPEQLSQILWAAGGATVDGVTGPTRAYPSAGGVYPLEIYAVIGNVTTIEAGIYKYNWESHSLTLVKKGDYRRELAGAAWGQHMVNDASVTIVITALYEKTAGRYGERGSTRYVAMDAGHMGGNVHLMAEAMGLGTVMVGAFSDSEAEKVLGIKGEVPIYMMPIGHPKG